MDCPVIDKVSRLKVKDYNKLPESNYRFSVHNSIYDIENEWNSMCHNTSIFLSVEYFKAIESCPPDDLRSRYLILWEEDQIVAFFPCQLKLFEAYDSIKELDSAKHLDIRKTVAKRVRFNTLISGNITVSGEYMYCFVKEGLTPKEQLELTEKVLDAYRNLLNKDEMKVSMTFMKDVPFKKSLSKQLISTSFKEFEVEPLMVVKVDPTWGDFNGYMDAMSSKYRKRVRRAQKKGEVLRYELCTYEEILAEEETFYKLYINVLQNVNFSLFKLPFNYFSQMKKHLGDKFMFYKVTRDDGKICAFYTLINNNDELHAHYLGYDPQTNKECLLYLNLLYQMIKQGINDNYKLIDLGRTALEIKSSVGAVPYDYNLYLKHKNCLANFFVQPVINILNKKTEWTPRSPFKT